MINMIENPSNNIFHPENLVNPVKSIITNIAQFCISWEIQYLTGIDRMNSMNTHRLMLEFGHAPSMGGNIK